VYRTYHNADQAITKLLIEAFSDAYLNALSDEVVGYANCTSLEILTHLLTYYAMIAATELTQNYERLNTSYDPNQPIETLFQQIQDAQAFAVAGGQPYGAAMIINVAYTLVFNTGLYPDACRSWQSRAAATKTWARFKIDFSTAHREFSLTNQTAQQSGFHSANMMIEHSRDVSMHDTAEATAQLRNSQRQRHPIAARLRRSLQQMQNLQLNSKRHMPSSHSSRRKSQRSRSRSNLYDKGSDRQEPRITTVIAGRTGSTWLSHTPVLLAV
jgi:hypothetical protein